MRLIKALLTFPVPYLLSPFIALWLVLVVPFSHTVPTYYPARKKGYDVTEKSLVGWMLADTKVRLGGLLYQLKLWPSIWKRSL